MSAHAQSSGNVQADGPVPRALEIFSHFRNRRSLVTPTFAQTNAVLPKTATAGNATDALIPWLRQKKDDLSALSFREVTFDATGKPPPTKCSMMQYISLSDLSTRKSEDHNWMFMRWDLVDLSAFRVKLKAEFQGSNRDLYHPETIVASSAK
ncbi:MAG TPA: hypothetical protein VGH08_03780 [Chthoniobacterales bacterium]